MYSKETTKKKIQEILDQHDIDIEITENTQYSMCYNKKNNSIKFSQLLLYSLYNRFINIEPEDIIAVAIYHELGHYLFYQRHSEKADRKTKELFAWKYGKELCPIDLLPKYLEIEQSFCTLTERM